MAEITEDIGSLFREYERPETMLVSVGNVHEWEDVKPFGKDWFEKRP